MWTRCPSLASCEFCTGKRANSWNFLLAAYCICLADANARFETSQAALHETGLCQKVIYYRPLRATSTICKRLTCGEFGCWQSHATVNGLHLTDKGLVLVLEDDICVLGTSCLSSLYDKIQSYQKCFDVFYIGGTPMFGTPCGQNVWKSFVLCTEAYITTQQARQCIVNEFENGLPNCYQIDQFLARFTKQYYLYPPIFSQRSANDSSIGYNGFMTQCMNFKSRVPCFCAAFMLSLLPALVFILVLLLSFCLVLKTRSWL